MNATKSCTWCGLSVGNHDAVCPSCGHPQRPGVGPPFEPARAYPKQQRKGTSGIAITSLVFGILGFGLLPFIGAIGALVCGSMGRQQFRDGETTSDGVATAGLVLGWIDLAYSIVWAIAISSAMGG